MAAPLGAPAQDMFSALLFADARVPEADGLPGSHELSLFGAGGAPDPLPAPADGLGDTPGEAAADSDQENEWGPEQEALCEALCKRRRHTRGYDLPPLVGVTAVRFLERQRIPLEPAALATTLQTMKRMNNTHCPGTRFDLLVSLMSSDIAETTEELMPLGTEAALARRLLDVGQAAGSGGGGGSLLASLSTPLPGTLGASGGTLGSSMRSTTLFSPLRSATGQAGRSAAARSAPPLLSLLQAALAPAPAATEPQQDEKPYKCKVAGCPDSFTTPSGRSKHVRNWHSAAAPAPAPALARPRTAARHRCTETDRDTGLPCTHEPFGSERDLKQHQQRSWPHASDELRTGMTCGACGAHTMRANLLLGHIKTQVAAEIKAGKPEGPHTQELRKLDAAKRAAGNGDAGPDSDGEGAGAERAPDPLAGMVGSGAAVGDAA